MSNYSDQEREAAEAMVWELFDAGFGEEEIATKAGVAVEMVESILGDREEEYEDGMSDAEADADTFASAGYGTDEDYGYFGGNEEDF